MFGPFHSSCFFWKVFVCLPSGHSLCTAFTKTQSALPIDVSGVRSANPCVCHHRVVQAGSNSAAACQLWNRAQKPPSSPGAAAALLGWQQRPAFAKIGCFCWQKGRARDCSLGHCLLLLWSPHPWGLGRVGVRDRQQQALVREADFPSPVIPGCEHVWEQTFTCPGYVCCSAIHGASSL